MTTTVNTQYDGIRQPPATLVNNQTVTDTWANLGTAFETDKFYNLLVWFNLDVNNSQNVRIRFQAKATVDGDTFSMPIVTTSASLNQVEQDVYEFNVDEDQKVVIPKALNNTIPFVQIQVMAVTPGAIPGTMSAKYSLSKN